MSATKHFGSKAAAKRELQAREIHGDQTFSMTGGRAKRILDDKNILQAIFSRSRRAFGEEQAKIFHDLGRIQVLLREILSGITKERFESELTEDPINRLARRLLAPKAKVKQLKELVLALLTSKDCRSLPDYLHILVFHVCDVLERHGDLRRFNQEGAEGMNEEFRRFWKTTSFGKRRPHKMRSSSDGRTFLEIKVSSSKTFHLLDAAAFLCAAQEADVSCVSAKQ